VQIILSERFQRDVGSLSDDEREQIFDVLLKLPSAIKEIHSHSGIGLRKIHSSGIYEARIGLGLRMVFGFEKNSLSLHRVGTHDEIRRYLKSL